MQDLPILMSCNVSLGSDGTDEDGKTLPNEVLIERKTKIATDHIERVINLSQSNRNIEDYDMKILNNQAFFTLIKGD
ncbi:MAG: hypothetical protein V3U78_09920 [Thiotrichaceae bacterium]